jgi:hypothetical protein
MGKKASLPPLDHAGKLDFIERHLFGELRYLLSAATEWSIQDQLKLEIAGYEVQVYAMDSAFVRARKLFEFFVNEKSRNFRCCTEFLGVGNSLKSSKYESWEDIFHKFLIHLQDRSSPAPLVISAGAKDLNQMPVDFALEALRLWEEFEKKLGQMNTPGSRELQALARKKRRQAIEAAENVVNSRVAKQHALEKGQTLKPIFVFSD